MLLNDSALTEHRRKFADLITESIYEAVQVLEQEYAALMERFPAATQFRVIGTYPAAIREFVKSDSYRKILDTYIEGRLEMNLLSKIVAILEKIAPLEFLRKLS